MTVKMTQRDKKLLSFLATFIVVVFFGTFAILPLLDDASNLNQQMEMAQQQKVEMEQKLALKDQYQTTLETLQEDWNRISGQLYDIMTSNEIDSLMTKMIQQCHLTAVKETITFVDPAILSVYQKAEPYQKEESSATADDLAALANGKAAFETAKVEITVEGNDDAIYQLTDQIHANHPGMLLTDIQYLSNEEQVRAKLQLLVFMCKNEVE